MEKKNLVESQIERSLFKEELCSFKDLDLGVNVGKSLLRLKSELDINKTKINLNRFESYLLDSLWHNLQNTVKSEGNNSPPQNF